jgi:hypothetical protein
MLWQASDIHGSTVEATDGSIGSVDDFLFSDDDWIIRWAVIDTGNWRHASSVSPAQALLPQSEPDTARVSSRSCAGARTTPR